MSLNGAVITLLDSMPARLRMVRLRQEYPRVLNRIATDWHDPLKMLVLMQGLIEGDRPNRAGFPPPVVAELNQLRDYYFRTIHPDLAPLVRGTF